MIWSYPLSLTPKQAQDQVKYGLGAGVEYQKFRMNVGEIIRFTTYTSRYTSITREL
jgi:hypothetical protein